MKDFREEEREFMWLFSKIGNMLGFLIGSILTFIYTILLMGGLVAILSALLPALGMIASAILIIIYVGLSIWGYFKIAAVLKRIPFFGEPKEDETGVH